MYDNWNLQKHAKTAMGVVGDSLGTGSAAMCQGQQAPESEVNSQLSRMGIELGELHSRIGRLSEALVNIMLPPRVENTAQAIGVSCGSLLGTRLDQFNGGLKEARMRIEDICDRLAI